MLDGGLPTVSTGCGSINPAYLLCMARLLELPLVFVFGHRTAAVFAAGLGLANV